MLTAKAIEVVGGRDAVEECHAQGEPGAAGGSPRGRSGAGQADEGARRAAIRMVDNPK